MSSRKAAMSASTGASASSMPLAFAVAPHTTRPNLGFANVRRTTSGKCWVLPREAHGQSSSVVVPRARFPHCALEREGSPGEPHAVANAPAIEYGHVQHIGLLVEDTAAAKQFYMDVLGMGDDHALRNTRLPFNGTFLKAGNSQIHLMELPSMDPKTGRPQHGGRDRHAAITVRRLEPLIESLQRHGVYYSFSKSGRRAVFLRDIDANALEFIEDQTL